MRLQNHVNFFSSSELKLKHKASLNISWLYEFYCYLNYKIPSTIPYSTASSAPSQ
jgi:hypothetical protein